MIAVVFEPTLDAFREAVRPLLAGRVEPAQVRLRDTRVAQRALFAEPLSQPLATGRSPKLPRSFFEHAELAAAARDDDRWDLLYRIAFRLAHGEPSLLELAFDPDVVALERVVKSVRHDIHAMHAFVRFRACHDDEGEIYVAWHRSDHHVLRLAIDFFVRRLGTRRFALLGPDESAAWDGGALSYGPGVPRDRAPADDEIEDLFRAYYGAAFQPARVNLKAMAKDMPVRRRATMPELADVPRLLEEAPARVEAMTRLLQRSALPTTGPLPARMTLPVLRDAAATCTGCEICVNATQTVFGEGPETARVVLVGEQPGDEEDRSGRPFVGPSGRLLDEVLASIGARRDTLYVTNAVKHFRWEPRGKQRLHRSPRASEIIACRPWLDAELDVVRPTAIVCLGAVAARSFLGPAFKLHKARGRVYRTQWAERFVATHHPSAILRAIDEAVRARMLTELADDLRVVLDPANAPVPRVDEAEDRVGEDAERDEREEEPAESSVA